MRLFRLAVVGAALMYFFDPQQGTRRRNMARDRALAFFRRRGRDAAHLGRTATSEGYGVAQKAAHLREEPKDDDDRTLKAKIESEVFRSEDAPKGEVDVDVENGVVFLRGEVERPELIEDLEQRVRSVNGVERVESFLHTRGA